MPPEQVPDPAPPNPQDPPTLPPPAYITDPIQPQNPLQNPPVHVPDPIQPENPPVPVPNPILPPTPPIQIPNQMQLQLNWSYFKPEFSGKPEEDAEAHLLRTNDWMEMHNFPEVAKVQRFCLTLTGEIRLWYETLRPMVGDWTGLQRIHYLAIYIGFYFPLTI